MIQSFFTRSRAYIQAFGFRAYVFELASRARRLISHDSMPTTYQLEISNCCNFDCEYCLLREQAVGSKIMQPDIFETMLPYLKKARSVALSGLAEPLMNNHFVEYLARLREEAPHLIISMITNASLLSEEYATAIVKYRLNMLSFSLDGTDASVVDAVRAGGSLADIIANIQRLNMIKKERKSHWPKLSATCVLQSTNLDQLPDLIDLAASLEVEHLTVNGLEPYSADLMDHALWIDASGNEHLSTVMHHALERAHHHKISISIASPRPTTPFCPQPARPIIMADGSVIPCSGLAYHRDTFVGIDENLQPCAKKGSMDRVSFGSVVTTPFDVIWNGGCYTGFRDAVESGAFAPVCDNCLIKYDVICPNNNITLAQFARQL